MSVWPFHLSKTILIWYESYHTHKNVKVFTATRQNKSLFFFYQIKSLLLSHHHSTCALVSEVGYEVGYETLLQTAQQNEHTTTAKIMKTLIFKEWSHISNTF